jgi:putative endonuclease
MTENASAKLGVEGEVLAARLLQSQGMKILARGFRAGHCEIDIVAADGKTLVFAEVKARSSSAFGGPLLAVTKAKQDKISACATAYLKTLPKLPDSVRFDVIAITAGSPVHIKDAFRPPRFSC